MTFFNYFFAQVKEKEEKRSASEPFKFALIEIPSSTRAPIFYKRSSPIGMTEAHSLPLGVPAFKPLKDFKLPSALKSTSSSLSSTVNHKVNDVTPTTNIQSPNLAAANMSFIRSQLQSQSAVPMVISPQANAFKVPAFQSLPSLVARIPNGQIVHASGKLASSSQSPISRIDVS